MTYLHLTSSLPVSYVETKPRWINCRSPEVTRSVSTTFPQLGVCAAARVEVTSRSRYDSPPVTVPARLPAGFLILLLNHLPIDAMPKNPPTDVSHVTETEDQLVSRAVDAINQSRWIVGECAAKWTQRYARGRTDVEFGLLVGLTGDQVYQRRRVWERFADVSAQFANLKWSHFYTALGWDDFVECLKWADDMKATVAEMKAWRRALRGEDLTTEATVTEDAETPLVQFVPEQSSWVQDPADFQSTTRSGSGSGGGSRDIDSLAVTGVAREFEAGDAPYSPFRSDALQAPKRPDNGGSSTQVLTADQPSTLQLVKRMTSALQRFTKLASPAFAREYRDLPDSLREKFEDAVEEFQSRVAELT